MRQTIGLLAFVMACTTVVAHTNSTVQAQAATDLVTQAGGREADNAFAPLAPPDPGLLLMLVQNDQVLSAPEITAWVDAAAEEGVRLQAITDKQFLALGVKARDYAGLVLPDQTHRVASDVLIRAIRNYTMAGGHTFLVFDFAALEIRASGGQFYAKGRSRLTDLAGIEYILYDELRERTTTLGPVISTSDTLRNLLVPPGKSIPFVSATTTASAAHTAELSNDAVANVTGKARAYSGYMMGNLRYASFVTRGKFQGTELARSPEQGLTAGVHSVGKGKVLFVNLPLTYLKLRTDALPLHGFMRYFVEKITPMARLSSMPDGIAGMTLNWHFDSLEAQQPSLELERLGIFDDGPFSIDITAGPDQIEFDDKLGWDLNNNPVAQALLQRLDKKGHSISSHGGWIHDYYGTHANETNATDFLPLLKLNQTAVANVMGRQQRGYSAPLGNNPMWAMNWLEQQGVVGVYTAAHTGLGPTRHYREGKLNNPNMWVFPVTPYGLHAVIEEFAYNNIPQKEVIAWYHAMVDFAIEKNTTRLVYLHPPWALKWKNVVSDFLAYAKSKGNEKFRWYTTERLADFMTQRLRVQWTESQAASGARHFKVSHPVSLREMVWILPKKAYPQSPAVVVGSATVTAEDDHWRVKAGNGTKLEFTAVPTRLPRHRANSRANYALN